MKKHLQNLLRMADLREEEVQIYMLLLKVSEATIPKLVELSGLNTMMVYRTLKRLYERGLIKEDELNQKQKIYKPLSLSSLIKKIVKEERKLMKLRANLKNLDSLLPFVDIESDREDDSIEIKEGIDAFREEYLKIPSLCKYEFLHVGSMHNYWETANMDLDCAEERNFIKTRMKNGVFARVLNVRTADVEEVQKRDSLEKRKLKIRENLPIKDNYFTISGGRSALFICEKENPRVILMKQPDLLALQNAQFSKLWAEAE